MDDEEEDDYAGPELPPDFDQEDVPDDEEGRFFGGGVTSDTTNALDFVERQEGEGATVNTAANTLRRVFPISNARFIQM